MTCSSFLLASVLVHLNANGSSRNDRVTLSTRVPESSQGLGGVNRGLVWDSSGQRERRLVSGEDGERVLELIELHHRVDDPTQLDSQITWSPLALEAGKENGNTELNWSSFSG
ncbi:unnamed protein product [Pleuronectes platessa]|uniref:Uncharacterized protein n=1 Tax=Pleuronectes platessa TaxID=8262 RepID=A0A9N7YNF3_PLEPL|nr:unnamed protein product [Pleuronectes platessa]